MIIEIKVPSPGESITEVEIENWLVESGAFVEMDDELAEISSDKATLTVNAEGAGLIEILAANGDTVSVGQVIAKIDTAAAGASKVAASQEKAAEAPAVEAKAGFAAVEANAGFAADSAAVGAASVPPWLVAAVAAA